MKTAARFTYSAFLRGPSDILPALERGDVVLERRDGVDLVLSTTDRANATHDGLDVGAATLAQIAVDHPEVLANAFEARLPWMSWLPVADRRACIDELVGDLVAGVDLDNFARFTHDLNAWRNTAEVWSDPNLAARLQGEFIGDIGEVPRPALA